MFFDSLFYRWKKNPAVLNSKQSSMKEILSKSLALIELRVNLINFVIIDA